MMKKLDRKTKHRKLNDALYGIGVKLRRVFAFDRFFGIHILCFGTRPPVSLGIR